MATKKIDKSAVAAKAAAAKLKPAKAVSKTAKAGKGAKAPRTAKPAAGTTPARHPRARVIALHKSKQELAKMLAAKIAREDEDTDVIAARLEKASNAQLLRLHHVADTVKAKFGSRDKLIATLSSAQHKTKDKDYVAKLETLSLPHLLDLATASQRGARA